MSAELGPGASSDTLLSDATQGVLGAVGVALLGIVAKLVSSWSRRGTTHVTNIAKTQAMLVEQIRQVSEDNTALRAHNNKLYATLWTLAFKHPEDASMVAGLSLIPDGPKQITDK